MIQGEGKQIIDLVEQPINKVGLVLLRDLESSDPLVCLTQVKAKDPAQQDQVHFGLPKGTRRYRDPCTGMMVDARTLKEAVENRQALEPFFSTLMDEAEQEIGLGRAAFVPSAIHELGPRLFFSRDVLKEPHDIQWYVMRADNPMVEGMHPNPPDAHRVQWFRQSEVKAMATEGTINASYAAVIDEAIGKMQARTLMKIEFRESQPTR